MRTTTLIGGMLGAHLMTALVILRGEDRTTALLAYLVATTALTAVFCWTRRP